MFQFLSNWKTYKLPQITDYIESQSSHYYWQLNCAGVWSTLYLFVSFIGYHFLLPNLSNFSKNFTVHISVNNLSSWKQFNTILRQMIWFWFWQVIMPVFSMKVFVLKCVQLQIQTKYNFSPYFTLIQRLWNLKSFIEIISFYVWIFIWMWFSLNIVIRVHGSRVNTEIGCQQCKD